MRKIITAWYKDALENGTISWDVTLSKALSLVLIAALAARSGISTKTIVINSFSRSFARMT